MSEVNNWTVQAFCSEFHVAQVVVIIPKYNKAIIKPWTLYSSLFKKRLLNDFASFEFHASTRRLYLYDR